MNTKTTIEEIRSSIRKFLLENYLYGYEENELEEDMSILEMGVLDSTGIIELVVFIEENFGFEVPDRDIMPENMDSINFISNYIYKKLMTFAEV